MSSDGPTITSLELEDRRFPPPPEFAAQANATEELYDRAAGDPEAFWLAQTKELLSWATEPTEGVDVMAKATIKDIIRAIAADGNAVLVSTSDRDEALDLYVVNSFHS